MTDPIQALGAAWRVTVLAICLLIAAHIIGDAWRTGALAKTLSDDNPTQPDLVGLVHGGGA